MPHLKAVLKMGVPFWVCVAYGMGVRSLSIAQHAPVFDPSKARNVTSLLFLTGVSELQTLLPRSFLADLRRSGKIKRAAKKGMSTCFCCFHQGFLPFAQKCGFSGFLFDLFHHPKILALNWA
jgi:hypothetical protein